ncbi:MAG: pyruvate dehydrogenase (acetyl-transferring) E1 component subunit alpha [Chloroflexi bacterium]|nr:pyruvate dehydrogenase (acetyl-transferring) E1 component subunit alpha [Chloroflexota bacterium]
MASNGNARDGSGDRADVAAREHTAATTSTKAGGRKSTARTGQPNGKSEHDAVTPPPITKLRGRPESKEELIDFYRQMVLIRRFEEKAGEMYTRAKIGGYCHLNLGEEATIVGLMSALEPRDYIFTNYREHGYILARGVDPNRIMAELFGKVTGVSRGRGGSMHLFDAQAHFMGGYAIVGGQLPPATGAGLAISHRGTDEVVVCQMGDGTTNIGAWHESLNIAQLWKLPVVFLVVNNQFGMGTTVDHASAVPEIYKKACAFNMAAERVDGNDLLAVRDATLRAVERGRREKLPTVVEAVSFRQRGHSVVDPDRYRSRELVERGRSLDPLARYAHALIDASLIDEAGLKQIDDQMNRIVEASVAFADESPEPQPKELFTFDYATDVPNVDRTFPGDHTGLADVKALGGR